MARAIGLYDAAPDPNPPNMLAQFLPGFPCRLRSQPIVIIIIINPIVPKRRAGVLVRLLPQRIYPRIHLAHPPQYPVRRSGRREPLCPRRRLPAVTKAWLAMAPMLNARSRVAAPRRNRSRAPTTTSAAPSPAPRSPAGSPHRSTMGRAGSRQRHQARQQHVVLRWPWPLHWIGDRHEPPMTARLLVAAASRRPRSVWLASRCPRNLHDQKRILIAAVDG
jgi:hypothetical protein